MAFGFDGRRTRVAVESTYRTSQTFPAHESWRIAPVVNIQETARQHASKEKVLQQASREDKLLKGFPVGCAAAEQMLRGGTGGQESGYGV
jgi:hypothetical protein